MQSWRQTTQNHISKNPGAIVVVFCRIFNKTKAVDITNEGPAIRPNQDILIEH